MQKNAIQAKHEKRHSIRPRLAGEIVRHFMNAGERIVLAWHGEGFHVGVVSSIDVDLGNPRAVGTDEGFFGLEFPWVNYIKISRRLIQYVAG